MKILKEEDMAAMKKEKMEWRKPSYNGKNYDMAVAKFLLKCTNCDSNYVPDICPKCGNQSFKIFSKPLPVDRAEAAFICSKCMTFFTNWGCDNCSSKNSVVSSLHILEKEGGCFIASAVYGSYSAPEVMVLREFRDKVLQTNFIGKVFIKIYYLVSLPIADFIAQKEALKKIVRLILIKPIITLLKR